MYVADNRPARNKVSLEQSGMSINFDIRDGDSNGGKGIYRAKKVHTRGKNTVN